MGVLEVEALSELMEVVTAEGAEVALFGLSGRRTEWGERVRDQIKEIVAKLEVTLDFPEEGIEIYEKEILNDLDTLLTTLEEEVEKGKRGKVFVYGAKVLLVGAPNVGKSTLLNQLLGEERAIVSPAPGTTRDFLTAPLMLEDLPLLLIDTAGIRESDDPVEKEGIRRAKELMKESDRIVWVRTPVDREDRFLLDLMGTFPPERVIEVWNKNDLFPAPPSKFSISAKNPGDILTLKKTLRESFGSFPSSPLFTTTRQINHLEKAIGHFKKAKRFLLAGSPLDLVAGEIRYGKEELERLLGKISPEEILDTLFSKFCIGK
jgi:tRNA modification GTPase